MYKSLLLHCSILLLINLCVIRGQDNYFDVLEAQFLSLEEEAGLTTLRGDKLDKVLTQEVRKKLSNCSIDKLRIYFA